MDFVKQAYEKDAKPIESRVNFARAPDFYERYFWSRRKSIPIEIQEALHLVRLAPLSGTMGDAMAFLGIRKAQEGLNKDPDSPEGYLALGMAYSTLHNAWDSPLLTINPETFREPTSLRYYQAVAALNQALIANPDDHQPRLYLVSLYQGPLYQQALQMQGTRNPHLAVRPDLVLREIKALHGALAAIPEPTVEERRMRQGLVEEIKPFQEYVDQVTKQLQEKYKTDDPSTQATLAQAFAQAGCFDSAARVIAAEPEPSQNPGMRPLRPIVLLETGDVATAFDLFREYENPALTAYDYDSLMQTFPMARRTAVSKTAVADYLYGPDVLESYARELEKHSTTLMLDAFRLKSAPQRPFPFAALESSAVRGFIAPAVMGSLWLDAGLLHLEAGQLTRARECLQQSLRSFPNAPQGQKMLVAHYLSRMTTDLEMSLLPQSDEIPIWHEDWKPEEE